MRRPSLSDLAPRFDGAVCDPTLDDDRRRRRRGRVFDPLRDGLWRMLQEIGEAICDPHVSISGQLRRLRKPTFRGYTVEARRCVYDQTWEYCLRLDGEGKM